VKLRKVISPNPDPILAQTTPNSTRGSLSARPTSIKLSREVRTTVNTRILLDSEREMNEEYTLIFSLRAVVIHSMDISDIHAFT